MSWFRASHGKYYGPGQSTRAAEKFTVDKVSQASQAEGDGYGYKYRVCGLPEGKLAPAAEKDAREQGADEPAMKRHAAVPDSDYFQRMLQVVEVVGELVKEDIAQTSSDNEPDSQEKNEVLELSTHQTEFASSTLLADEEVTRHEA